MGARLPPPPRSVLAFTFAEGRLWEERERLDLWELAAEARSNWTLPLHLERL